jgi:hypothetical protein
MKIRGVVYVNKIRARNLSGLARTNYRHSLLIKERDTLIALCIYIKVMFALFTSESNISAIHGHIACSILL